MKVKIFLGILLLMPSLYAMDSSELAVCMQGWSERGKRDAQEDRYQTRIIKHDGNTYYCSLILDGHAGESVAQLARDKYFDFFEENLKQDASVVQALNYARARCEALTTDERHQY